jgi:FPC/CPF motif-containing protein YcgG
VTEVDAPAGVRARDERVEAAFRAFVADPRFPCLAAKGVMRSEGFRLQRYGVLGSARSAARLARDLAEFVSEMPADGAALHSFVAVFPRSAPADEREFERRLWQQLQRLHEHDAPDAGWDPTASADPDDPRFAFSLGGRALFVVGIHPASSRLARRFRWPALVFNPHAQFERLRADGRFTPLRAAVREREIALQGTLNPNLADFGEQSEARQYSGRAVGAEWRCPFHRTLP